MHAARLRDERACPHENPLNCFYFMHFVTLTCKVIEGHRTLYGIGIAGSARMRRTHTHRPRGAPSLGHEILNNAFENSSHPSKVRMRTEV